MRLSSFQYELPRERVAQYPADRREDARLLSLGRRTGAIDTSARISALPDLVREGDCWVINDTRVRPARLLTRKVGSGGRVELLVLSTRSTLAEVMVRSSRGVRAGLQLRCELADDLVTVVEVTGGGHAVVDLGADPESLLERAGRVPLPPYIERAPEAGDAERYQTIYARVPGAVAAPTAGLHFTPALMASMEARGATFARVTLHVGPGTFRPIRSADVRDHTLHAESYAVPEAAAERINAARRVVAVGTTSVRTLETVADDDGVVHAGSGETRLYIMPGRRFRVVDALLTNFHLPGSSLLVLVAAFCGLEPMHAAYRRALDDGFRFYSYGDAMFIS